MNSVDTNRAIFLQIQDNRYYMISGVSQNPKELPTVEDHLPQHSLHFSSKSDLVLTKEYAADNPERLQIQLITPFNNGLS
jgi:hypothetical protein